VENPSGSLIEEIARVIGYDNLPMSFPQVQMSDIREDSKRQARNTINTPANIDFFISILLS